MARHVVMLGARTGGSHDISSCPGFAARTSGAWRWSLIRGPRPAHRAGEHDRLSCHRSDCGDRSVGLDDRRSRLEERYCTWNEEDFLEFQDALQAQRKIDAELWQ